MKILKKIILVCLVAVLFSSCFAPRAGVHFGSERFKFDSSEFISGGEPAQKQLPTETNSETGFYLGVSFTELEVSDDIDIQPEINYVSIKDLDQVQVPVLARFNVSDQFNILAGPNFGFLFDTGDGINSFNLGLDAGVSYDISDDFLIEARYGYGISNLFENGDSNNSLKLSGFQVGVSYRLKK